MYQYEYIVLNDGSDDEPSIEQVIQQISENDWCSFECDWGIEDLAAEEILKQKYGEWEIYDEDEGVYLAIRLAGKTDFEVYRVSISYVLSISSEMIYDRDDSRVDREDDM